MTKNQPSLKLRQNLLGHQKQGREDLKKKKNMITHKEVHNDIGIFYLSGETAFKALLSARFCAAIWSHISDCDETYNYWEPVHYLVFGKGLQTWEYSPEFALRSYLYLMIHAAPAYIYHKLLQPNPMLIFYFTRCLLGVLCTCAEVYFYKAVCREFGLQVGRLCLAFQLFSAGMFNSSTALLPSSWAMYGFTTASAAWWQQKYALAVLFVALSSLLGWPFAALLGLPIAFDILIMRRMYRNFVKWSLIFATIILVPMVAIDSIYYGRIVIAPWNIIKYNVLGKDGANLYGTEPFSFYLLNGFLNFNFIWVFAVTSPMFFILEYLFIPAKNKSTLTLPNYISLAPLFLWLAVFMAQAHKEERFLFPIYPLICLSGAITVDIFQKLIFRLYLYFKPSSQGAHYLNRTLYVTISIIAITSVGGLSRIFSLYRNYHAPLDLFMELNRFATENKIAPDKLVNVCIGKDWHRFPSSFFLPNSNWNIKFVQSDFKGILPAPYSSFENATTLIHNYFNDKNKEEPSLYFPIDKCHFLIDLNIGKESLLEPNYAKMKNKWKILKTFPFLNPELSSIFFRSFYVPFISDKYVQFGNFSLLQAVKHIKIQ